MGLLKVGHPLHWNESKKHSKYVREHGVRQFLNTWFRIKDIRDDVLKYGEEIEVGVFSVDKENKALTISTRAPEVLSIL
jgi:glutamate--cysteine ligase catalytic subunit